VINQRIKSTAASNTGWLARQKNRSAGEPSAHLSIKSKFTINLKIVFCAAKRRIICGKAKTILDTNCVLMWHR
jgi:hypothetical protein